MRERGIPFFRQLCTVDGGVSLNRETAVVPPKASMR